MLWLDSVRTAARSTTVPVRCGAFTRLLTVLVLVAAGCGATPGDGGSSAGAGTPGGDGIGGEGGATGTAADFLTTLDSLADFSSVSGEGAEVKYLAIVNGVEAPAVFGEGSCLFQNTARYPYHLQFLRTFPDYSSLSSERYVDLVLRRASRVMWGGGLKLLAAAPHPLTDRKGVLAYTVYSESTSAEMLTVDDIVEVDRRLKARIPVAAEWLVFTPDGIAQTRALEPLRDQLLAEGVVLVDTMALRPGLTAETYSEGESYGTLRFVPAGEELDRVGPRDVLIVDAAPHEIGLIAGLVTRQPQSMASHVNLRLREKGIPSATVPDIFDNTVVAALVDGLVHVSAQGDQVTIEAAHLEDAEAFWRSRQPALEAPPVNLEATALESLDAISADDVGAFGTKASNLGELSRVLPEQNRVVGFAIPARAYADFMDERGLSEEVESLLADPHVRTDLSHKQARLAELRTRIRSADLLPDFVEALREAVRSTYGQAGLTTRLRFRSSTNAEDLPGVSGAGLYDSRSGCLADDLDADASGPSACLAPEHERYLRGELERRRAELVDHPERSFLGEIIEDLEDDLAEEKSAYRAVRRVWASLWNERAFDDREYYGIDHRKVFMAIAVHPTFVGEQLEAVAFTNLEPNADEPLYRVVSQAGEVGVVDSSDPTATPEITTFRRAADPRPTAVTLVQPSSLSPDGAGLWSNDRIDELGSLLFQVQDHFAASVYPSLAPLMLDVEVDVAMDGHTVIKQARPYTSGW